MKTSSSDKPPCQKLLSTAAFFCIASSWGQDDFQIDSYPDMGVSGWGTDSKCPPAPWLNSELFLSLFQKRLFGINCRWANFSSAFSVLFGAHLRCHWATTAMTVHPLDGGCQLPMQSIDFCWLLISRWNWYFAWKNWADSGSWKCYSGRWKFPS